MKARYIRISTPDQKLERQLIKQHPDEKIYIDVISGSVPFDKRPGGQKLLQDKDLKYVTVHAIDRLGRNLLDILTTLQHFEDHGTKLKVENLGIESLVDGKPNPAFKLIISVLANIAEMERNTMLERQREGIELARAKGKYKGRVRGSIESREEILAKYPTVIKRLKEGHSLRNTAKLSDVSLGTVQKVKGYLQE
ncbi:recombinase family protein [Maribacter aestuarii]|uniref:recombinase family protein n=1 Tax=Maribacter aestuarii TaxID=1130723 RepID=UPI00248BF78C|nr:recombinase family protein [Maribacter aestuarii]